MAVAVAALSRFAGPRGGGNEMIRMNGLTKVYGSGTAAAVHALCGVDLTIGNGEMVAIMGPSGSGKSTMMNLLGCLDRPTAGTYTLADEEVSRKTDNELADVRNRKIGFVFQTFNLLAKLTALQNVETPLIYRGMPAAARRAAAERALAMVGLADRAHHRPAQLSGGQMQRVAIARAVATDPAILLGDEPTGALDSRTGEEVMAIFQDLHRQGRTVILVTHDEKVADHCDRIIRLRDGQVVSDEPVAEPLDARAELAKLPPLPGAGIADRGVAAG